MAVDVRRGYLRDAEKLTRMVPEAKNGLRALGDGLKKASVIVGAGIGGQLLGKYILQGIPSSEIIRYTLANKITLEETFQEFETSFGRVIAVAALSLFIGTQLVKKTSFVNKVGFIITGITTLSVVSISQIVEKTLSLSGATIDPSDKLGRKLPSVMGIALDPFVCKLAFSTAILSMGVFKKVISFFANI